MVKRMVCALAVLVSVASVAGADVLYFDDITTGSYVQIPNGYGGFDWWPWVNDNAWNVTNTWPLSTVSQPYCAVGKGPMNIDRPDERLWNGQGAYFSAVGNTDGKSMNVHIMGSYRGTILMRQDVTLQKDVPVWADLSQFQGIERMSFASTEVYFTMDDFSYSLIPIELPRGTVVVDFEDRYMGASELKGLPLGYKGIMWNYNSWVMSENNYYNNHQRNFGIPHSGEKYVLNYGQAYDTVEFSFDAAYYPEAELLGAWFGCPNPHPEVAGTDQVRWVSYDASGAVTNTSQWLVLTPEPQYMEAIDAATGLPFDWAAKYVVEYTCPPEQNGYGKFLMDDVTFESDPVTYVPVAQPGGPYVSWATDWNGAWVELDGSASQEADAPVIVGYAWDLDLGSDTDGDGDAANDVDATAAVLEAYFGLGLTDISLRVTDEYGTVSEAVATTVTVTLQEVTIDVKPGDDTNTVVINRHAMVPVVFFSDANFDATTLDPMTITLRDLSFADGLVKVVGRKHPRALTFVDDWDMDGDLDLFVMIDLTKAVDYDFDGVVELGGLTYDGTVVMGTDTIRIRHRGPRWPWGIWMR